MSSPAPVTLLRNSNTQTSPPHILLSTANSPVTSLSTAEYISFPTTSSTASEDAPTFPLSAPSGYKSYSLLTILYFLQYRHLEHATYLQQCLTSGIESGRDIASVSFIDRRDLDDYLMGVSEGSSNVAGGVAASSVTGRLVGSEVAAMTGDKMQINGHGSSQKRGLEVGGVDVDGALESAKRPRLGEPDALDHLNKDKEIVAEIISRERTIHDRKKVMAIRGTKNFANIQRMGQDFFLRSGTSGSRPGGSGVNPGVSGVSSSKPNGAYASRSNDPRQRHSSSLQRTSSSSSSRGASSSSKKPHQKPSKDSKIPIIVVPAAAQATLTLYNVKDFLQDS
ncbi:hypothetical protein HK102_004856, partial [Quaeritorhiza haematococci]